MCARTSPTIAKARPATPWKRGWSACNLGPPEAKQANFPPAHHSDFAAAAAASPQPRFVRTRHTSRVSVSRVAVLSMQLFGLGPKKRTERWL